MKLGTDPEIAFVTKNGHVVPAGKVLLASGYDLIDPPPPNEGQEQTKGHKLVLNEDCLLYEDGMSDEFNISPSGSPKVLINRVKSLLQLSLDIAKKQGLGIEILPTIPVTKNDIESGGVVCARFGCDPDESIYNDGFDPARVDAKLEMNRFFGCHIHASATKNMRANGGCLWIIDNIYYVMSAFDLVLGLADVIYDHSDQAKNRRKVYGRAGRHRIQLPYGLEYRTPGNSVLRVPSVLENMFSLAKYAMVLAEQPHLIDDLLNQVPSEELFDIITGVDFPNAKEVYAEVVIPALEHISFHEELQDVKGEIYLPINYVAEKPKGVYSEPDFISNWGLNE